MKCLVVGAGNIGWGAIYDLVHRKNIKTVGLLDFDRTAIARILEKPNCENVKPHIVDITDTDHVLEVFKQYDVGIITMPDRRTSYKAIEAAIRAGLDVVDILEEYHRRPDKHEVEGLDFGDSNNPEEYGEWLHEQATNHGVTIIDGMGFAPGLSNITLGHGIRKLDNPETAIARVGGIPDEKSRKSFPLSYIATWAFHHVIREYMVKVLVIKDGEIVEVEPLTDRESFRFNRFGKDHQFEAAITPGMPSFIYSRPDLVNFCEKTIRWPGHWESIDTLKECGLFDLTPVKFDGQEIVPREFFSSLITPRLQGCDHDKDICVMYNTVFGDVDGKKVRIDYYMWDEADLENDLSAMSRATAFPAVSAAVLLVNGKIKSSGIIPPEDAIYGDSYDEMLNDLKLRNIGIEETITLLDQESRTSVNYQEGNLIMP